MDFVKGKGGVQERKKNKKNKQIYSQKHIRIKEIEKENNLKKKGKPQKPK